MKTIRWQKIKQLPLKSEAGYVMTWVLILSVVAGFVLGPFLAFMLTGTRASYSHADTMAEFYAADSGLEDAIYKVANDYSATAGLAAGIGSGETDITVDDTSLFPERGVIRIESELIYYSNNNKATNTFEGCTRGYDSTSASNHNASAVVTAELPSGTDVGDTWEYGIEDINDKEVDITIETLWTLEGLEDPSNGTTPHQEFVTVGQMLDTTATALTAEIDAGDILDGDPGDEIEVSSTSLFPKANDEDPSIVRIDDELFQYTGQTATEFTGVTRAYGGTAPATHTVNTAVTSEEVTYKINITVTEKDMKIDRIGAWLPPGFDYVPGTSNIVTYVDGGVFPGANSIPVDDHLDTNPQKETQRFPDSGTLVISYTDASDVFFTYTVTYTSKSDDSFDNCTWSSTSGGAIPNGTPVSAEPVFQGHHGGTAIIWTFNNIPFENLPREYPLGGGSQPRDEFPTKRTITFNFSPPGLPKGIFSWARSNSSDIYLSWDTSGGSFKITSTATDPNTGTQTSLESYIGATQLTGRISTIYGDARAIGNSLIRGDNVSRDELYDESSAFIDSAHGNAIPDGSTIEAAYLYWSGWRSSPWNATGETTEDLAPDVNQAVFNGTLITADRVQTMPNTSFGGWSFSCFKDVTIMLEPAQTADITLSSGMTTESVTIAKDGGFDNRLNVQVTVLSGPAGGYVTVDGTDIDVGDSDNFSIRDSVEMTSGNVAGDYSVRVRITDSDDRGTVDGTLIDGYGWTPTPDNITVDLTTTQISPEATITKISGGEAIITIINTTPDPPSSPSPDIEVDDSDILTPGDSATYSYISDDEHTVEGVTSDRDYSITVTCTKGIVHIDYGNGSVTLGEPGSQMTNGEYTLGRYLDNPFVSEADLYTELSYAGWSLIVVYSHPDEPAHQLFLYDDFTYVSSNANNFPPNNFLEFAITGFQFPADIPGEDDPEGILTCFIGEGDPHYVGDYIQFNGYTLPLIEDWPDNDPYDDPYDEPDGAVNPKTNVWNGISSVPGIEGSGEGEGVDIDAFLIKDPVIQAGDTAATIKMDTGTDIWNIVYIFLSFETVPTEDTAETPVGIHSFGYVGG